MLFSNDMDFIHIWRLFGQRKLTLIRKIDCSLSYNIQLSSDERYIISINNDRLKISEIASGIMIRELNLIVPY